MSGQLTHAEPENKHKRGLQADFVWCGLNFVCQERRSLPGLIAPRSAHAWRQDDWAPFRSAEASTKLHALLDLRGAIPAVIESR